MNGTFFCNKCGAQNVAGSQFCARCGTATIPIAGAPTPAMGTPNSAPSYPAAATQYPAAAPVATGYAGFWIRFVAFIIDAIIVRVVVAPIGMIFGIAGLAGGMTHGFPHLGMAIFGGGVTFMFALVASWLYEALMESSSYQATLGKMIFGMKVTDLNGNRISFAQATGRHFAKLLSWILFIGFIMVGFTERKQGLHDILAGTLVLKS